MSVLPHELPRDADARIGWNRRASPPRSPSCHPYQFGATISTRLRRREIGRPHDAQLWIRWYRKRYLAAQPNTGGGRHPALSISRVDQTRGLEASPGPCRRVCGHDQARSGERGRRSGGADVGGRAGAFARRPRHRRAARQDLATPAARAALPSRDTRSRRTAHPRCPDLRRCRWRCRLRGMRTPRACCRRRRASFSSRRSRPGRCWRP